MSVPISVPDSTLDYEAREEGDPVGGLKYPCKAQHHTIDVH